MSLVIIFIVVFFTILVFSQVSYIRKEPLREDHETVAFIILCIYKEVYEEYGNGLLNADQISKYVLRKTRKYKIRKDYYDLFTNIGDFIWYEIYDKENDVDNIHFSSFLKYMKHDKKIYQDPLLKKYLSEDEEEK